MSAMIHPDVVALKRNNDKVLVGIRGSQRNVWIPTDIWNLIASKRGELISPVDLHDDDVAQLLEIVDVLQTNSSDSRSPVRLTRTQFFGHSVNTSASVDAAILLVPFDSSNNVSLGSRNGPDHLAKLSRYLECELTDDLSGIRGWYLPKLADSNYVGLEGRNVACYITSCPPSISGDYLSYTAREMVKTESQAPWWLVGGDHSITFAGIQYLSYKEPKKQIIVLVFDAHLDAAPFVDVLNSANIVGALLQNEQIKAVYNIGSRGVLPMGPSVVSHRKLHCVSSVREIPTTQFQNTNVYCSIDLDVLDPSVAPGVSAPVPGGMDLQHLERELLNLAKVTKPVGGDIVEYQASNDQNAITAQIVFRLLIAGLSISVDSLKRSDV